MKKNVSQAEADLFRAAMGHVKPLPQQKQPQTSPHHPKKRINAPEKPKTLTGAEIWLNHLEIGDWLDAEDPLHFARTGLQHKTIQRLKRGQLDVEAELDLHRQTLNEAMATVTDFIADCLQRGNRCVSIIHGKGRYSAHTKPVLKNFLNQWLREQPDVLAFQSAIAKHGGTGALYVLLKRGARHEK